MGTVRAKTGYTLSNAALCQVRLGALYALRDLAGVLSWAESFLEEWQRDAWQECKPRDIDQIDGSALQVCGAAVCGLVREHEALLQGLPDCAQPQERSAPALDAALEREASEVGAAPQLWQALPPELRPALREELENPSRTSVS